MLIVPLYTGRAYPAPIESPASNPRETGRPRWPFRMGVAVSTRPVPLDYPHNSSPLASRARGSEGYPVVVNVGGSGAGGPASLAMDPPSTRMENSCQRKGSRAPAEPGPGQHELEANPSRPQGLDGTTPRVVGEGGFRNHMGAGSMHDVSYFIRRGEVDVWDVGSNSEGTALPPYTP